MVQNLSQLSKLVRMEQRKSEETLRSSGSYWECLLMLESSMFLRILLRSSGEKDLKISLLKVGFWFMYLGIRLTLVLYESQH
jgi:hypothetical protein